MTSRDGMEQNRETYGQCTERESKATCVEQVDNLNEIIPAQRAMWQYCSCIVGQMWQHWPMHVWAHIAMHMQTECIAVKEGLPLVWCSHSVRTITHATSR